MVITAFPSATISVWPVTTENKLIEKHARLLQNFKHLAVV